MTQPVSRRTLFRLAGVATASAALAGAVRAEGGFSILPARDDQSFAVTTPLHVRDVTLRVRDMAMMSQYYRDMLGLSVIAEDAENTRLGVDGITLLTLQSRPEAPFEAPTEAGLYHTAFLMPSRADLARWLVHAAITQVPLTGFADHRVSEAVYLDDPEGNGIEVYADRAPELWTWSGDSVVMGTEQIDFDSLLALTNTEADTYGDAPAGLRIGHIHLRAGQIDAATKFYVEALGLDVTSGRQDAIFLSSGRYHHHVALNTWQSAGAGPRNANATGLAGFSLLARDEALGQAMAERLLAAGQEAQLTGGELIATDPWGTQVRVVVG